MSSKTLTLLFGIFLALLALVLLQFAAPTLFAPKQSAYQKAIQSLNTDTLHTITITKQQQTVSLVKKNTVWQVQDKKANSEKVNELLDQLVRTPKADIVAQTNTRHTELEVRDDVATHVIFDPGLTLLVGKSGTDGLYVRIKDNDTVYVISNASAASVSPNAQDWYDKTIFKADESAITQLDFHRTADQFTIIHDKGTWKLTNGNQPVTATALSGLLADLSSFQAQSLADEASAAAYSANPELSLTIEKKDGKETLLYFAGSPNYLVKRTSDGMLFSIPEFQAKHALLSAEDMVKKEPVPTGAPQ